MTKICLWCNQMIQDNHKHKDKSLWDNKQKDCCHECYNLHEVGLCEGLI
jgi:hypothetical protein